jgi:predicted nucleic acid-binding protein
VQSSFTVVYDACVLYPAQLRDLLLHLAMTDLFRAKWSADIHKEWIIALLRNRPDLDRDRLERTRFLMDSHVRDCLVVGYEDLIAGLQLPDPNDRHVLACAIRSGASLVVTDNLEDFPPANVAKYGIEAIAPDDFLANIFDLNPAIVMAAIRRHKQGLKNPSKTWAQYIDSLAEIKLQKTADLIRQYLPQFVPAGEV